MVGSGLLAESLAVLLLKLSRGQTAEALDLFPDSFSFLMSLTSSQMRALYLRQVNLRAGRSREEQADECIAQDGGNFVDGLIERGVAIAHERSPLETTQDDLRFAVEPASGGCDRRGVVPCPLTIYAAQVGFVRPGVQVSAAYERT